MSMRTTITAAFLVWLMALPPASAQPSDDQGLKILADYMAMKAIAQLCKFQFEPPIAEVMDSNIKNLVDKFNVADTTVNTMLQYNIKVISGGEKDVCAWGQDKFNAKLADLLKNTIAKAMQAGVVQAPIPPSQRPLSSFPPDSAADIAANKAQHGIAGYSTVLALSRLCGFTIDPALTETISGNIHALQPVSRLSDQDLDLYVNKGIFVLEHDRLKQCGDGQVGFNSRIVRFGELAEIAADGSGVVLKALIVAQPALAPEAKSTVIDLMPGLTLEAVVALVHKYGDVDVLRLSDGNPEIRIKSPRAIWLISPFGCGNNTNCRSIQLFFEAPITPKPTIASIDRWNQKDRCCKAYIDKYGDANITYDIDLSNGFSPSCLNDTIDGWLNMINDFNIYLSGER